MLSDGQQFDVRITHAAAVFNEFLRQFTIRQPAIGGAAHPGFEMHFVNGNGVLLNVAARARFHPLGIAPFVVREIPDDGGGARRDLGEESVGV